MKKYYLHIFVMVGYFLFVAGSCGEEPEIVGCTDLSACNYNIEATILDASCIIPQENFDCAGGCLIDVDCTGECGGSAEYDECGACGGDGPAENFDCIGNCISQTDDGCECTVLYDECEFCGGDNSSCTDCNEDLNGLAFIDGCENCVGGNTGLESCPSDCLGIDGGTAWINPCIECVPENDITCLQGCDGNWSNDGSKLIIDDCGICGGNNSTCTDCDGIINGLSFIDSCGNCIESMPASWKIEIMPELVLMNSDSDTLVDASTNYLGADILYTDGFDGCGVDMFENNIGYNPSLSFSFYHSDWYDVICFGDQYYNFTEDIRNHNYYDFLYEGKTWNAELKSINNWYDGTAKITFHFIDGLSDANIIVDVIIVNESGSDLSVTSYSINDGDSIDGIIMNYNYTVQFIIQISNLCY